MRCVTCPRMSFILDPRCILRGAVDAVRLKIGRSTLCRSAEKPNETRAKCCVSVWWERRERVAKRNNDVF